MLCVQTLLQDAGLLHGEHQLKLESVNRLTAENVVAKLVCVCVFVHLCVAVTKKHYIEPTAADRNVNT